MADDPEMIEPLGPSGEPPVGDESDPGAPGLPADTPILTDLPDPPTDVHLPDLDAAVPELDRIAKATPGPPPENPAHGMT